MVLYTIGWEKIKTFINIWGERERESKKNNLTIKNFVQLTDGCFCL